MSTTGDVVEPESQAIDPIRSLRGTLRGLATVVAPTSVVTSLLYYFGWTRALSQSKAMGFDSTLLGFSTQEYLLQSLAPMFWPLLVGLLAAITGLLGHIGVVAYASDVADVSRREDRRRQLRRLAAALAGTGLVLAALGLGGAVNDHPSRLVSIAYPLCLSASIVLVAYAAYLRQRFRRTDTRSQPSAEMRAAQFGVSSLVVLLLLLSLFWSVTNYAGNKGVDLAIFIEHNLSSFPDARIYSAKRLYLRPPIVEKTLDGQDAAYRFEYTGLGFAIGNVLQALVFLAPHLLLLLVSSSFWPLLPVQLLAGWLLGLLRERSGSIGPPTAAHVAANVLGPLLLDI